MNNTTISDGTDAEASAAADRLVFGLLVLAVLLAVAYVIAGLLTGWFGLLGILAVWFGLLAGAVKVIMWGWGDRG